MQMLFGAALEREIEMQCLHWLSYKKYSLVLKIPTTGYYDTKLKRFRKQSNPYARAGHPDILFIYRGFYIGLEIKSKKGKQSEAQKEMERQIRQAGGQYLLVHSLDELMDQIDPILAEIDKMCAHLVAAAD